MLLCLFGITGLGGQTALAQECMVCHGMVGLDAQRPKLTFPVQDFEQGSHASLGCPGCHTDVGEFPHEPVPLPQCSACHSEATAAFDTSVHGKALARGDRDVATCESCHGSAHALKAASDPNSLVYHLNLPRTCGACHGDPELARRHGIRLENAYQLYMDSIHGRAVAQSGLLVAANCSSCHGSHEILPRENPSSKVFRGNIPSTCGACHAGVLPQYAESIHGLALKKGDPTAPVCADCHTAHEITRVDAEAWKLEVIRECGACHEESLRTYRDTFHGQVTALGFTRVARCSDCHGSHEIFPASDARSLVSPAKRVASCQKCHPRANENFALFSPHADPKNQAKNPSLYYAAQFMNLLLMGVFVFFGLHTGLWLTRSLVEQSRAKPQPPQEPAKEEKTREGERKGWGA